jgi:hypothetical protein
MTEKPLTEMPQDGRILGINRRCYPTQGEACEFHHACKDGMGFQSSHIVHEGESWCDDPYTIIVVLVQGQIGDYAAYAGIGSPEWVAKHGDKIRFEEAVIHFPQGLVKEKYRD